MAEAKRVYQLHLDEPLPEIVFQFDSGEWSLPEGLFLSLIEAKDIKLQFPLVNTV